MRDGWLARVANSPLDGTRLNLGTQHFLVSQQNPPVCLPLGFILVAFSRKDVATRPPLGSMFVTNEPMRRAYVVAAIMFAASRADPGAVGLNCGFAGVKPALNYREGLEQVRLETQHFAPGLIVVSFVLPEVINDGLDVFDNCSWATCHVLVSLKLDCRIPAVLCVWFFLWSFILFTGE